MTGSGRKTSKFDRILVVDPNVTTAKLVANLLRSVWPSVAVYGAQDAEKALLLAGQVEPELVFVEAAGPDFDGMAFSRAFRRSDLAAREAPIIMVFSEVKAAQILGARDSGVHEFLRRPISMGDLERRLDAVSGRPRDWIEGVAYVGPDRRRFNSADYQGASKRRTDGNKKSQKINQALRIIQAASRQIEAEPVQAARALSTQARILIELSAGHDSLKRLGAAAALMQTYLQTAARQGTPLARDQVEACAANVVQAAPERPGPRRPDPLPSPPVRRSRSVRIVRVKLVGDGMVSSSRGRVAARVDRSDGGGSCGAAGLRAGQERRPGRPAVAGADLPADP